MYIENASCHRHWTLHANSIAVQLYAYYDFLIYVTFNDWYPIAVHSMLRILWTPSVPNAEQITTEVKFRKPLPSPVCLGVSNLWPDWSRETMLGYNISMVGVRVVRDRCHTLMFWQPWEFTLSALGPWSWWKPLLGSSLSIQVRNSWSRGSGFPLE